MDRGSFSKVVGSFFSKNRDNSYGQSSCPKSLQEVVSSKFLAELEPSQAIDAENGMLHDPNRRVSLGAESLLEHDINEEGSLFDYDGNDAQVLLFESQLEFEYADDIFLLNRSREQSFHQRYCMNDQPQVTEYMRCTIINWLVKVNHQLKFGSETIFIAVSLTDRFLASTPIAQDCLQLLSVCALFVAAKLEESAVPGISVLVNLSGTAYRHHHFRRMEALLLSTLGFELHAPTSWFFVTNLTLKICRCIPIDKRILNIARYVIETCLGSYRICQFLPSEQAGSALVYACFILYIKTSDSNEPIFQTLCSQHYIGGILADVFRSVFKENELREIDQCAAMMSIYMKPFMQTFAVFSRRSSDASNFMDSEGSGDISINNGSNLNQSDKVVPNSSEINFHNYSDVLLSAKSNMSQEYKTRCQEFQSHSSSTKSETAHDSDFPQARRDPAAYNQPTKADTKTTPYHYQIPHASSASIEQVHVSDSMVYVDTEIYASDFVEIGKEEIPNEDTCEMDATTSQDYHFISFNDLSSTNSSSQSHLEAPKIPLLVSEIPTTD